MTIRCPNCGKSIRVPDDEQFDHNHCTYCGYTDEQEDA